MSNGYNICYMNMRNISGRYCEVTAELFRRTIHSGCLAW